MVVGCRKLMVNTTHLGFFVFMFRNHLKYSTFLLVNLLCRGERTSLQAETGQLFIEYFGPYIRKTGRAIPFY